MTLRLFALVLLLGNSVFSIAQKSIGEEIEEEKTILCAEEQRYHSLFAKLQDASAASEWFDVTFYSINLFVSTSPNSISGDCTIKGIVTDSGQSFLVLDLMNNMTIESITVNDSDAVFEQFQTSFIVELPSISHSNDQLTLTMKYFGVPVSTGFGSFIFGTHSGTPWVWSLSEPYGARDWFPCKNHPNDKADSADIVITIDASLIVVSNGKLASVVDNTDGTRTFHWQERYPIASYLLSLAISNYNVTSKWFHYSATDSMEIVHYIIPEKVAHAETSLVKTIGMLEIFSDLFGLYPFIKEKYGYADFGFGGAMEHQTITSTTTYQEGVLSHELAHQWFGDMITCRSWQHIWLNEGFAQYAEALYMQRKYNDERYWLYINADLYKARSARGTIFVQDTSTVKTLFDAKLVYSKGSSVLHMLRHVLGDSVFFQCMHQYATAPHLQYATATTADFQEVCEQTSGKDLDYYFKQWIYGENYPHYSYWWKVIDSTNGYTVQIGLTQETATYNPLFFTMPIDFLFKGLNLDTTVQIVNNQKTQYYLLHFSERPDSVKLDPLGWILKDVTELPPEGEEFLRPYNFSLVQNYPNPFNSSTTISYVIDQGGIVNIEICSLLGQPIATLYNDLRLPGKYQVVWNVTNEPSGLYFCRITSGGKELVKPMILLK